MGAVDVAGTDGDLGAARRLGLAGLLAEVEKREIELPHSDRSKTPIEPYLADQWFVKMDELAQSAMDAVSDERVQIFPTRYRKGYLDWLGEKRDWPVSRQLWWGHRVPAWYDTEGNIFVGHDEDDVRKKHGLDDDIELRQDEDVLDTWFSSGLWPFSTLGWPEDTEDLRNYYPTSVLETGYDILFFWVARMIMAGYEFMGDTPFTDVYLHGTVRDRQGRKMSKSLGNGIDPLHVTDLYGADALRFTLCP